jgi:hypothetical protein
MIALLSKTRYCGGRSTHSFRLANPVWRVLRSGCARPRNPNAGSTCRGSSTRPVGLTASNGQKNGVAITYGRQDSQADIAPREKGTGEHFRTCTSARTGGLRTTLAGGHRCWATNSGAPDGSCKRFAGVRASQALMSGGLPRAHEDLSGRARTERRVETPRS